MASDELSQWSEDVPKGTPAVRCIVVVRCADAYALNGKYADTPPMYFKIADRGSGLANQRRCTKSFRDGTPADKPCVYIIDSVPICPEAGGSDSPSPGGDVIVTVGAGPSTGDHFYPAPIDDGAGGAGGGAGEAPGPEEGADPGAGET